MQRIQLNHDSGVPVFRQIIDQVVFMIEAGDLKDGDRLPSSRLLAANLGVNRNTTARSYTELKKLGYLESRGRAGMVVRRAKQAREHRARQEEAVAELAGPVRRCLELGLSADEIAMIAYHESLRAQPTPINVTFVECNAERAKTFAAELSETVNATITPLVLDELDDAELDGTDLVVTTFFHHADVRRSIRAMNLTPTPEVLAIVAAPHIKTLGRLSRIPKGNRIGILYSTDHQAEAIHQSLTETGLKDIHVLHGADDPMVKDCDYVIVPSENPEIGQSLGDDTRVIEYGNVLDPASHRMMADIVDEVREQKDRMLLDIGEAAPAAG